MSKYHVGDAVKVRGDLMDGELYGNQIFIGDDMMECRGRLAMITKIDEDGAGYRIDICPQYFWTDEMFDESVNAPAIKVDLPSEPKKLLDTYSGVISQCDGVDKLTLVTKLADTLVDNLDANIKDMILRYMLLDFFERFIENGNG